MPVQPDPVALPHIVTVQVPETSTRCAARAGVVLVHGGAVASTFALPVGEAGGSALLSRVALPSEGARAALWRSAIVTVEPGHLALTTGGETSRVPLESVVAQPAGVAVRSGGGEAVVWPLEGLGPVVVVDPTTGRTLRGLVGHEAPVLDVVFGPRGATITTDQAGWVRIFDATGAGPVTRLRPFDGAPAVAAVAGQWLAMASGPTLRLWELDAPQPAGELVLPGTIASLGSDGERIVAGLAAGGAVVIDPARRQATAAFDVAPAAALCMVDGWLAVAGRELALVPPELGAPPPAVPWTSVAPADPVNAISDDTFVGLYHALRCAQAGGDARRVVGLLESYGVADLPSWARASGARLERDRGLLLRLTEETAKPCP